MQWRRSGGEEMILSFICGGAVQVAAAASRRLDCGGRTCTCGMAPCVSRLQLCVGLCTMGVCVPSRRLRITSWYHELDYVLE